MRKLDYGKMGMRIRQVRKAKGWSQNELAEKCGISMSFLGHIERGSRIMSMETFANICMALDAGADELLWGVAAPSEAVLDMWNLPGRRKEQKGGKPKVQKEQENQKAQEECRQLCDVCQDYEVCGRDNEWVINGIKNNKLFFQNQQCFYRLYTIM